MTASCSDFCNDVLQAMCDAGLLRQEDVPDDNPERQTGLALDVLKRLVEIKDLGAALAALVQNEVPAKEALKRAAELTNAVETIVPRWLASDSYGHCFIGATETRTRWAVDLETGKMVYAESFGGLTWSDMSIDEKEDLREDVMDANEVRLDPPTFGAVLRNLPPLWASGVHANGQGKGA
jgi:hypothetical protein